MRLIIFIITIGLLTISCQSKKDKKFYFGGQIINPLTNMVYIRYQGNVIDTLPVDNSGKFGDYVPITQEGLYEMIHGNDNEQFYAEINDSLLIFVNTLDFKESTYYSGKGSDANNFLLEYKQIEQNRPTSIFAYSYLEEPEFIHLIDSAYASRIEMYEQFKQTHEVSSEFDKYIKEYIDLPYYTNKEIYPVLRHENSGDQEFVQVETPKYYEFRTLVPIYEGSKNDELMVDYLFARLTNETVSKFYNEKKGDMARYFETKMEVLKDMDVPKSIKQEVAKRMLSAELTHNVESKQLLSELQKYKEFIYDEKDMQELTDKVNIYDYVRSNGEVKSLSILSKQNDTLQLKEVLGNQKKWILIMNDELTDARKNQELCNAVDMAVNNNPDVQILVLLLEEAPENPSKWHNHYQLKTPHETFYVLSKDELNRNFYLPRLPFLIKLDKENRFTD